MPYGIPEEKGGDSPKNKMKMEHCIKGVKKSHPDFSYEQCIKICKKQLGFTKDSEGKDA